MKLSPGLLLQQAQTLCLDTRSPHRTRLCIIGHVGPRYGREFLQTEDEISAGFTVCGAVQAGKKAFTATAGPGNVLMQEPFGMAEAMRLPLFAIIQQRGGPSSGTVIYSQQEVALTTYGGNGEGYRIVYSSASHQEIYDYTIKGFNMAWKYRWPTFYWVMAIRPRCVNH